MGASTSSSRLAGAAPGAFFDTARPYDAEGADLFAQALFPELAVPGLRETQFVRNGKRIACKLLGAPPRRRPPLGPHALQAGPHRESAPWHQDEAYWEPDLDYHAVGNWMPLDDADIDNGCLWFPPGSHRLDVLAHKHKGDDPAVHILELVEPVDTSAAVPVPTRAGGAPFHHPHAAPLAAQHDRPRTGGPTPTSTRPSAGRAGRARRASVDHRGSQGLRGPNGVPAVMPDRAATNPAVVDPSSTRGPCRSRARRRARRRRFGGGGTQGRPNKLLRPDERAVLGDIAGPEWCATSGSRSCPPRPSSSAR